MLGQWTERRGAGISGRRNMAVQDRALDECELDPLRGRPALAGWAAAPNVSPLVRAVWQEAGGQTQQGHLEGPEGSLYVPRDMRGQPLWTRKGPVGWRKEAQTHWGLWLPPGGRPKHSGAREICTSATPGKVEEVPSRDAWSASGCSCDTSVTPGSTT